MTYVLTLGIVYTSGDTQISRIILKKYLNYLYKFETLVPIEELPLRLDAAIPEPLPILEILTIQNYQRDALNIIYSSNIITLLYMFRESSTHLQEDIVVHKQHMVPSLSIRVLVSC